MIQTHVYKPGTLVAVTIDTVLWSTGELPVRQVRRAEAGELMIYLHPSDVLDKHAYVIVLTLDGNLYNILTYAADRYRS